MFFRTKRTDIYVESTGSRPQNTRSITLPHWLQQITKRIFMIYCWDSLLICHISDTLKVGLIKEKEMKRQKK
jgi:hypothetical protein